MQSNTTHLPSGDGTGAPTRFSFIISSNVKGVLAFCANVDVASAKISATNNFIRRKAFVRTFRHASRRLGSACVSRAGFGVAPKRTFSSNVACLQACEFSESSRSRGRARQHAKRVRYPRRPRRCSFEIPTFAVLGCLVPGIWCFSISVMAHVTIDTIKNGPYIVTGEVELIDADGNRFPVEKRMALCRCGASTEKPFCDGTHSKIGFKAAEKAVPESKE